MAGGGGGGPFISRSPEELAKQVRETEDETAIKAFETRLGSLLSGLLAAANSRDAELGRTRLDAIKKALGDSLERSIDTMFGGSVAKHTYVDGLSDVDSLLIFDESSIGGDRPSKAIAEVANVLRQSLNDEAEISTGKLAVTITYKDGMSIQLLPAFRTGDVLKVPSFRRDGWSGISPEAFQKALTDRNAQCGGKLVPTIKLAKAIIGTLPEGQRLTGYHVESLGIAAFRDYTGPKTAQAMLPVFFEKARQLVVKPVRDSTGQSVHVDEYLGAENSKQRVAASHVLGRIAKRMRNASAHMSSDQWQALFDSSDG